MNVKIEILLLAGLVAGVALFFHSRRGVGGVDGRSPRCAGKDVNNGYWTDVL